MNVDEVIQCLEEVVDDINEADNLMEAIDGDALGITFCLKEILSNDQIEENIKNRAIECLSIIVGGDIGFVDNFIIVLSDIVQIIMSNLLIKNPYNADMIYILVELMNIPELNDIILKNLKVLSQNLETLVIPVTFVREINMGHYMVESVVDVVCHDLLSMIIEHLDYIITKNDFIDALLPCIQILETSSYYQNHFVELISRVFQLMQELKDDVEKLSICFTLVGACIDDIRPSQFFKIVDYIEKMIPIGLSTLYLDSTEWNPSYLKPDCTIFEQTKDILSTFQLLDTYGKSIVGFFMKESNLPKYLQKDDWKSKMVALETVILISKCFIKKSDIDSIVKVLFPICLDHLNQHPQVRKTLYILITEFCDCLPPVFKETHHEELVKILMGFLNEQDKNIIQFAYSSVAAFFSDIPKSIGKEYIPVFMPLIIEKLKDDSFEYKGIMIDILSSISSNGDESVIPYFVECVPVLLSILKTSSDIDIHVNIIDALSISAAFLGDNSNSELYWQQLVDFLIKWEGDSLTPTDKRITTLNLSWHRLLIADAKRIKPLVNHFLPRVLESALSLHRLHEYELDNFEVEEEEDGVSKLADSINEQVRIKINSVNLCIACLEHIPDIMEQNIDPLAESVVEDIGQDFDKIDIADFDLATAIIKYRKETKADVDVIIDNFQSFFEKFINKPVNSLEKLSHIERLLDIAESNYISPYQSNELLNILLSKLIDENEKSLYNSEDLSEDFSDEITRILLKLISLQKEDIIVSIYPFWWYFEKHLFMDSSSDSYCIISDIAVHCYPSGFPIIKQATSILVNRIRHTVPGTRQSICYAIGGIASNYPDYFHQYLDKAIPELCSIIMDKDSRSNEDNSYATDNAVLALGKIILSYSQTMDVKETLKIYLAGLPVSHDEFINVYNQIINLIKNKDIQNNLVTSPKDFKHLKSSLQEIYEKVDIKEKLELSLAELSTLLQTIYPQYS